MALKKRGLVLCLPPVGFVAIAAVRSAQGDSTQLVLALTAFGSVLVFALFWTLLTTKPLGEPLDETAQPDDPPVEPPYR